ncbi:DUF5994 family protein [Mycolicibacterium arenosum]|uniref:DUF5994 family protein n=1 Tax=Mycolicibacterium arenosum TaxID=2952157 RepID=A0ABT1LUZ6_9MYCO|nr:DUF5994 family protein [Mycolicibacterium sp. CAU 1645]MCP9270723.1 DUF5994 family protein [Mycolicibacterium sp. CAU 1645]
MVPTPPSRVADHRLAFCSRSAQRGGVDGAWWPATTDLTGVLPDLLSVVGSMIGEVRRVVYDPRVWLPAPSRMIRRGVSVALDPYAMVIRESIYLVGTHTRDAVLYVIPATCDQRLAMSVLTAVSAPEADMNAHLIRDLVGQQAP